MTKLSDKFSASNPSLSRSLTVIDEDDLDSDLKSSTLDLSNLTLEERLKIFEVLKRNDVLRTHELRRVNRLKNELSWLRRRGAVRVEDGSNHVDGRSCARCRQELGRFINRGAPCRSCRQKVCKQCRHTPSDGTEWVCVVCYKNIEIQLASGEWMNEFIRRPSRRRDNRGYVSSSDLVKKSLRRSWTISSPVTECKDSNELTRKKYTPRKPPRFKTPPGDSTFIKEDLGSYQSFSQSPPRRYSMSSFDAPSKYQKHSSERLSSSAAAREETTKSKRRLPEIPNKGTAAAMTPPTKPERPSTLPRQPRRSHAKEDPVDQDPDRFHSIPRRKHKSSNPPRSQQHQQQQQQHDSGKQFSPISPLRENPAYGGFVSSGPVTNTPIVNSGTPALPTLPMKTPRVNSVYDSSNQSSGLPSDSVYNSSPTDYSSNIKYSPNSNSPVIIKDYKSSNTFINCNVASRTDSGVSESSRYATSDNSDYDQEGSFNNHFKQTVTSSPIPRPRIPRSSTSVTSDESIGSPDEGVGGSLPLGHHPKASSPSPVITGGDRVEAGSHGSLASSDGSQVDEDIQRLLQLEKKRNSLTPLGSRSESMASVCSTGGEGRYGTVAVKGEIQALLQYNYKEGQLECHIIQCKDLAPVDIKRNRSDPYVKVYLLPDKSKSGKRKTKVKKHTLNPMFEEILKFSTTMSELDSRTLWISVWHSDMFGRNDFLGEVVLPLADQVFDNEQAKWYSLQERTEPLEDVSYNSPRGDLIIGLKFVPPDLGVIGRRARRSKGALHVLVKEAKALVPTRPHGTADPICKGLLLPDKGKSSKQKTSVCRKTLNPVWGNTLIFEDVSLQDLTERSLELSVWDHDRLGASQFLAGCRLNLGKGKYSGKPVEWMDAVNMEMKIWSQMLDRPNLWVEGSLMLRPAMDKPIYSSSLVD